MCLERVRVGGEGSGRYHSCGLWEGFWGLDLTKYLSSLFRAMLPPSVRSTSPPLPLNPLVKKRGASIEKEKERKKERKKREIDAFPLQKMRGMTKHGGCQKNKRGMVLDGNVSNFRMADSLLSLFGTYDMGGLISLKTWRCKCTRCLPLFC